MLKTSGQSGSSHQDQTLAGERERESGVSGRDLRQLLEQQGYRCALTGELLTPDVATCDHVRPISKGGANVIGNIQIVHKRVNDAKGVMDQREFVRMCEDVVRNAARQHLAGV